MSWLTHWRALKALALRPATGLLIGAVASFAAVAGFSAITDAGAATREEEEAATVAEWKKHPVITICEDTEGRRFVVGRTEPPPDAPPDLKPITVLIRLSGDTCGQSPASTSSDPQGE
jgi:hypothetical protein